MSETSARELRRQVIGLYTQSWVESTYAKLKMIILPFEDVAANLPKQGRILDMGCGFGYVANYLSLESQKRVIIGNDPAEERIAVAKRTVGDRRNIEFHAVDSRTIAESDFDGAYVTDVLHHVPYDQQQEIIDDLYRKLKPGGTLVVRETDVRPAVRYYVFNLWLELLINIGRESARFRKREEWAAMFRSAGFTIENVIFNTWWFPYTTCMFVCRKPLHA
jgi:2-polyprenyl-3-methyl-5-hydroxy-6-metoxy-1,4-benzoquinol methylase